MNKYVAGTLVLIVAMAGMLLSAAPAAQAAGTGQTCTTTSIPHPAVTHQEHRYSEVIPGTAAVTHTEYRIRTRTALYGSQEIKKILGWNFVAGGPTRIDGQDVAGQWEKGDSATWYTIPAVIINIVWGPSGVPASVLGSGTVSLSFYGGPKVTVEYQAVKVQTTAGYTDWGPWSDWSTQSPGAATDTTDVDSRVVVDQPAVPASTVYYLPGGGTSTSLTDANWTTDTPPAPWTLLGDRTVTDTPAWTETKQVCTPSAQPQVTVGSSDAALTCQPSKAKLTLKVRREGTLRAAKVSDVIKIEGLPAGATLSGTATLYGPSAHQPVSTSAAKVGTVAFTGGNGQLTTKPLRVTKPGFYAWAVTSSAAGKQCGAAAQSILAHRPALHVTRIPTGFAGQVPLDGRRQIATVSIPALGIHAALQTVGSSAGQMRVPGNVHTAGWLAGSAASDELIGTTLIAGHVSDRSDRPGAFWNLRHAKDGQIVSVRVGGVTKRFKVTSSAAYNRNATLPRHLLRTTGAHQLVLVTCTGRVSEAGGHFHYRQNLVVVARPVR